MIDSPKMHKLATLFLKLIELKKKRRAESMQAAFPMTQACFKQQRRYSKANTAVTAQQGMEGPPRG